MNKKIFNILKVFPCCFAIVLTLGCTKNNYDTRSPDIASYLDSNDENFRAEFEMIYSGTNFSYQDFTTLINWEFTDSFYYNVHIADNKDFKNEYVYTTRSSTLEQGITVPGKKYFYKVYEIDYDNMSSEDFLVGNYLPYETNVLKEGSFKVKKNITRFVNIDGLNQNIRDIGGWRIGKNKKINYELVYRGTRLYGFSSFGKHTFRDLLGIKTEIDLRDKSDRADMMDIRVSNMGEDINYVEAPIVTSSYCLPMWKQESPIARSYYSNTQKSLYNAFKCLANKDNYPVYFHCNAGADRTGTFAFLLEGLLGVDEEYLYRDFELTSFSAQHSTVHFRGPLVDGKRTIGTTQDDKNNYVAIGTFRNNLIKWYGKSNGAKDDSVNAAIENYLTSFIGITNDDITAIRNILVGKL